MSEKDDSACAVASALVPLESLTNSTLPRRPTCSIRCARPGKLRRPRCRVSASTRSARAQAAAQAEGESEGARAGGVLGFGAPPNGADAADPRHLATRAAGRAPDNLALRI